MAEDHIHTQSNRVDEVRGLLHIDVMLFTYILHRHADVFLHDSIQVAEVTSRTESGRLQVGIQGQVVLDICFYKESSNASHPTTKCVYLWKKIRPRSDQTRIGIITCWPKWIRWFKCCTKTHFSLEAGHLPPAITARFTQDTDLVRGEGNLGRDHCNSSTPKTIWWERSQECIN